MLQQDSAVPEDARSQQVWQWLRSRFPDQTLTLQTQLQADLQIDSLGWMEVTLEIGRHCGIELPDDALYRTETIGDLLQLAREAGPFDPQHVTLQLSLDSPEIALGEDRRYWLLPLGPVELAAGWCLFALNWALMRLLFRIRVQGLENLPENSQFVLAPHHTSYLDALVLGAVLPFRVMKHSYWAAFTGVAFGPLFRLLRRFTHVVPVDVARGAASSLAYPTMTAEICRLL
ncbi:1-acyl-sn-glycerol-3-phosphate acyltransferase [Anatilimnocola floriformis]|uniref:1-acyl-sn-glycerol-3-phosphate acyltransferase n=1 Tax=Anatilimnocola floriformis TaxID=2948575 RepID=UPI0020C56DC5|nr:1-acyl-sn-glycerol-3-phosphate acyltransferase [Anatilimnocola floriformis]